MKPDLIKKCKDLEISYKKEDRRELCMNYIWSNIVDCFANWHKKDETNIHDLIKVLGSNRTPDYMQKKDKLVKAPDGVI